MGGLARRARNKVLRAYCSSGGTRRPWITCKRDLSGQALVEFTLVLPLFLFLIFAIFGFGLIFQNKIALDNAVRDGARFASTQPSAWTSAPTAPNSTIEWHIQNSGGIATVANSDSSGGRDGINIEYFTVDQSTQLTTECGFYTPGSAPPSGYTAVSAGGWYVWGPYSGASNELTCLAAGNLVKVTATINYPIPAVSGILSRFFNIAGTVRLQSSATMTLEQSGS